MKLRVANLVGLLLCVTLLRLAHAEDLPPIVDNPREGDHYAVVDMPIPSTINLEAGSFLVLPDQRLAIGTRRGDIYFVTGAYDAPPDPQYHLFASGLHEVFGLAYKDGWLYATQQCEVTRIKDLNGDGRADRFETVSDGWGFGGEHEFTFGSRFDRNGDIWVVLCLTGSYRSENLFRGWCLRVSPDGTTTPTCSGIRSPGGVAANAAGDMFYMESQGPWNGACSLKHLRPGGFMGHPIGNRWYENAPNMGPRPAEPTDGRDGRRHIDARRIPELVPSAIVFPYKKMGQSASCIMLDESDGKFGPFAGQMFVGDYTLSLVMRADLEKVGGVYQGACFPFRQNLATGIIGGILTEHGQMFIGGSKRGWPVRGIELYALQRLQFTGNVPFEVHRMRIRSDGFLLTFTQPVDPDTAADLASYRMGTYTHHYRRVYGSPELDHTTPAIRRAVVAADGRSVRLIVDGLQVGHIHELHMPGVRNRQGAALLHDVAYYTVNAIPGPPEPGREAKAGSVHPFQKKGPWVTYEGKAGPGKSKHIVFVTGDEEYRSEESMPMMAKILAERHGFHCTVLFAIDKKTGLIDPMNQNNIPGLDALETADLMVVFTRFRMLPDAEMAKFVKYVESGRPVIGIRTATHAFEYRGNRDSPYAKWSAGGRKGFEGGFGRQVLGETWINHYGGYRRESTRGIIAKGREKHPIVRGCDDIWGPSHAYLVGELHGDSEPLVLGQPLRGHDPNDPPNPKKAPIPVAWTKTYTGTAGKTARVFTTTMGYGSDFKYEGVRRMVLNACYWCVGLEDAIPARSNVDVVGTYDPMKSDYGGYRRGVRPSDHALERVD